MSDEKPLIKKDEWSKMSFDQLLSQKNIMIDKYIFLAENGYREQAAEVYKGIQFLDSLMFKPS